MKVRLLEDVPLKHRVSGRKGDEIEVDERTAVLLERHGLAEFVIETVEAVAEDEPKAKGNAKRKHA